MSNILDLCPSCGFQLTSSFAGALMGRKGGKVMTEKKRLALIENGKKGGWPKGKPRKKLAHDPQNGLDVTLAPKHLEGS